MEFIESHYRSKVEEREVEVVFQKFQETIVPVVLLTVLQGEAHASHDGEAAASVEEEPLKLEASSHETLLTETRKTNSHCVRLEESWKVCIRNQCREYYHNTGHYEPCRSKNTRYLIYINLYPILPND